MGVLAVVRWLWVLVWHVLARRCCVCRRRNHQPVLSPAKQARARRCALSVTVSLLGGLLLLSTRLEPNPDLRELYEQLPRREDCGPDIRSRSEDAVQTRRLALDGHQDTDQGLAIHPYPHLAHPDSWRPDHHLAASLYRHLNISTEQVASQIPLTLQGPDRLENRSLCRTPDGGPPDIVFLVHSATNHSERRLAMRSTFLNSTFYPGWQVRTLFLLGETTESNVQWALEVEHAQYGDLLQGHFLDGYHNLTQKAVLGIRWLHDHCSGLRVVVKLDDDVFLDPFKLRRRYWSLIASRSKSMWCFLNLNGDIERKGKWAIEQQLFQKMDKYPYCYCGGLGVIFTGDLLPSLLAAARYAPLFWVDDVYVYGMLPHLARNVSFHQLGYASNVIMENSNPASECVKDLACPMLITTTSSISQLQHFWHLALLAERIWTEKCKVVPSLVQQPGDLEMWTRPVVQL